MWYSSQVTAPAAVVRRRWAYAGEPLVHTYRVEQLHQRLALEPQTAALLQHIGNLIESLQQAKLNPSVLFRLRELASANGRQWSRARCGRKRLTANIVLRSDVTSKMYSVEGAAGSSGNVAR